VRIFCSGIGGIGLSAYAALQAQAGHQVSGSDKSESAVLDDLRSQGVTVTVDQGGDAVQPGLDLFVYSEAIPPDAPERRKASKLGIPQKSYPEALGEFQKGYRVIAVCGTHGKSSTTAMAARMLVEAGFDPTIVVGTKVPELNGRNWRKGGSDWFVVEACEYRNSFLHYTPEIILLTTCDGDHFDFYASMEAYRESFVTFLKKLPAAGVAITHGTDADCRVVTEHAGVAMLDADAFPFLKLKTPGKHMQQNAQLVLALAEHLNIPRSAAEKALEGFTGTWRRMEVKGECAPGVTVVDDYAHHPAEIRATLEGMRTAYPGRRILCVFQPHTHDRTLKLYGAFTQAFRGIDTVIIPGVYVARKDIETATVDVPSFVRDIEKGSGVNAIDGRTLDHTEAMLPSLLRAGDVLVCMGAGTITNLATRLVSQDR
jgi:UDP-N-acetylmuramate--alanine ligase